MSQYETIDENTLWVMLEKKQRSLEHIYRKAIKARSLTALGEMVPVLRRMHWTTAFLGLTSFADIAAGGAAFIAQLQDKRSRWSPEITTAVKTIVLRTRAFCDARKIEPSAGVFLDSQKAVLQGTELKRPVPTADLMSLFRRRQIDVNVVSAVRQLSVGQDESFSHAITVPAYAKKRHRANRYLSLVYLDLENQEGSVEELIETLEKAVGKAEILLHGPLAIPWKNYRSYKAKRPYYLLLDTVSETASWLEGNRLNGRSVKDLKKPEDEISDEPRVIIREIHSPPYIPPRTPSPAQEPASLSSLEYDGKRAGRSLRKREKIRNRDLQIRFPVGAKLILIVSAIIITAMSSLSVVGLFFFRSEIQNRVEDTNISLSRIVAQQAEKELVQIFDSANLLFQVGSAAGGQAGLVDDFFANSRSLVYVGVPGSGFEFSNRDWFRSNRIFDEQAVLSGILAARSEELEKTQSGETVVINVSPLIPNLETPVVAMAAPFLLGNEQKALVVLADIGSGLAESVRIQEGLTTTVIVNSDGEILAHPDFTRIFGGEAIRDSPVFNEMYAQGLPEGQIRFTEETINGPVRVIGSFALIPLANLGVVTTVLERDAFDIVNRIQILNLSLLGAVLSLTILGVFYYSQSLSKPLKELALATRQIKAGNYEITIEPKTKDEVGQLTRNFMGMIPALKSRERLMEKIEAFVNRQVARMIDNDSLPDHAETKDVTVFFSDVRGFTSMSEAMGDPQLVLDNLSEYFRAMVPCVEETQGTVDKFIGDAVMAVWGSMTDIPNNAEAAINGALMMRAALRTFNVGRGTAHRPFFQIGCGLNSGPATVGIMGDQSTKMEWAHMGDTVNLASRIEQLNKPMGTDILISQSTADKVEGIFSLVPMNKIKVKGKSQPQQIYAVLGRLDDDERPRNLAEMRAMVGISGSFSEVADTEEHEVKYEILDS